MREAQLLLGCAGHNTACPAGLPKDSCGRTPSRSPPPPGSKAVPHVRRVPLQLQAGIGTASCLDFSLPELLFGEHHEWLPGAEAAQAWSLELPCLRQEGASPALMLGHLLHNPLCSRIWRFGVNWKAMAFTSSTLHLGAQEKGGGLRKVS